MSDAYRLRAEAFTGRLQPWARIPGCFGVSQIVASSVDLDGRLIALIADAVARAAVDRPYRARAVVVGPSGVTVDVELEPLDAEYPMIDALGDGFVVADARNRRQAATRRNNLRVVGPDGSTVTSFNAGDAIEHLLVDRSGDIWTGYFDEGELLIDGSSLRPLPGLGRWKPDGSLAWLPAYDGVGWMDCYALNVGAKLTWGCPYTEFPLVTVDRKGVRSVRGTSVRGARGLLVAGPLVAFLGEYDDYRHDRRRTVPSRQVTVSIGWNDDGDGDVPVERKLRLTMPDGSAPPGQPRQIVCRDDRAFVRFDDPREWFLLEL
jgi:hypothetical protein